MEDSDDQLMLKSLAAEVPLALAKALKAKWNENRNQMMQGRQKHPEFSIPDTGA